MGPWRYGAQSAAIVRLLIFMTVISSYLSSLITDSTGLFFTAPQPRTRNVSRPYALHVLFVRPASAPDGDAAAPARDPISVLKHPRHSRSYRIVVPAGWAGAKSRHYDTASM